MGNRSRAWYYKFFRRLIATSRPEEIPEIVEKYEKQHKQLEANFIDISINTEGAFNYDSIMRMPLPSIELLVERINAKAERMSGKSKQML